MVFCEAQSEQTCERTSLLTIKTTNIQTDPLLGHDVTHIDSGTISGRYLVGDQQQQKRRSIPLAGTRKGRRHGHENGVIGWSHVAFHNASTLGSPRVGSTVHSCSRPYHGRVNGTARETSRGEGPTGLAMYFNYSLWVADLNLKRCSVGQAAKRSLDISSRRSMNYQIPGIAFNPNSSTHGRYSFDEYPHVIKLSCAKP